MKLLLDHHYSSVIARNLRQRGHDVVTAAERGWGSQSDESLLGLCHAEQRVLLTNNVADFAVIIRQWAATGRAHAGVIFTSDARMPRNKGTVGRYVRALHALLRAHPSESAFVDTTHWLTGPPGSPID